MRTLVWCAAVIVLSGALGLACNFGGPSYPAEPITARHFPIGHIDSPFMLPDGSAIYFLHSPVSTRGLLKLTVPWTKPASQPFPGHHGTRTLNWYNSDLYVSQRNPGGGYGRPENLGSLINTDHFECCPWVNDEQTLLVFTREGIGKSSETGTYLSRRSHKGAEWGPPQRLEGELGAYLNSRGIHDLHITPSGDVYGWSESEGGHLFFAKGKGQDSWRWEEVRQPSGIDPSRTASQPWVSDDETVVYFNRWEENGDRELWRAERPRRGAPWGRSHAVRLNGFQDPAGRTIWGEPSFTRDGSLVFVRFDTSRDGWPAELLLARRNQDGSFGPPQRIQFHF